jgi:lipopolysaccharide/colanic/teichoic acid biosynthesis glycosyltransferase
MKRVFDVAISSLGLLLLSPVFLLIAIGICFESPGPVFFRQERVGKDGIPFLIFKFRTMVVGASMVGPQITAAGDPRVTRIGKVLRRTKLDELPQLINVWRGEMSIVGPRPELPSYVMLYDNRQKKVLTVRPGITDPASIAYVDEECLLSNVKNIQKTYIEDILPKKLELNLQYVDNKKSLLSDLKIILLTFSKILKKRGAI